jgi:adenylosuccinate lyase
MDKVKVKEIKDDAVIDISVNKSYYLMVKAALFDLFTYLQEKGISEESLKNIVNKQYAELSQQERTFYTITLLLAEIERQATLKDLFDEKEFDPEAFIKKEEESKD